MTKRRGGRGRGDGGDPTAVQGPVVNGAAVVAPGEVAPRQQRAEPAIPPAVSPEDLSMQFAMGMVTNLVQHMRLSGLHPLLIRRALLRGAGMAARAFRLPEVDVGAEIQAGSAQQEAFEAQVVASAPVAGAC